MSSVAAFVRRDDTSYSIVVWTGVNVFTGTIDGAGTAFIDQISRWICGRARALRGEFAHS
jgi:hypothetical protein